MLYKDSEGNWTVKGMESKVAKCYDLGDSVEVIFKSGGLHVYPKPKTTSRTTSSSSFAEKKKDEEKKDEE